MCSFIWYKLKIALEDMLLTENGMTAYFGGVNYKNQAPYTGTPKNDYHGAVH